MAEVEVPPLRTIQPTLHCGQPASQGVEGAARDADRCPMVSSWISRAFFDQTPRIIVRCLGIASSLQPQLVYSKNDGTVRPSIGIDLPDTDCALLGL